MKSTATTTLKTAVATALLSAGMANIAVASDNHDQQYIDYARVIDVVPKYKYVTVSKPHRQCETIRVPQYNNRPHRHNQNRNRNHRHSHQRTAHNRHHNTHSAEFVGAVIGGAIGNKVTRSVNGNGNLAATVAGAVIGSSLARQVADNDNRRHTQRNQQSQRHFAHQNNHHSHNSRHNTHYSHTHRQPQRTVSQQRCYTTTTTHQERRADGFNVTYSYRGQTFTTHMKNDPGHELRVRVEIKPH